jgi:hypothetical protein
MKSVADGYPVTLNDAAEANGVAQIIGTLLSQNLEQYRSRVTIAQRMSRPVTILATDIDSACTTVFARDSAVVYNDVLGRPAVTVNATVDQILNLSKLRMKAGGLLPVGFFSPVGRGILLQILTRKLVVKGLLLHPITALRTIALVSVVDS